MDILKKIKKCFENDEVLYTHHAMLEMRSEDFGRIFEQEVSESITNGEIIEKYPDGKPYPSVLIFGNTSSGRPVHVVCAYNKDENLAIIITVYEPNPEVWIQNKKRRE
jgi:hypothetical protein